MDEIWRDVKGYEGRYIVSDHGRFMSFVNKKWQLRTGSKDGRKYITQWLVNKDGSFSIRKIARLVALNFIPNPHNYIQVNHIDGDRNNNHVSNLEWCSNRENSTHRNQLHSSNRKSKLVGAGWDKSRNKFVSIIKIDGKQKNLGRFNTAEEAHKAYVDALEKYGITNRYVDGITL